MKKNANLKNLLLNSQLVTHHLPVNWLPENSIDFEAEVTYETDNCFLREYKSVLISPHSVLYQFGKIIPATLTDAAQKNYYQYRHLAKLFLTNKKVVLSKKKKYLLVTDHWSEGHFHWFTDVLPKLLLIESQLGNFTLLLPDVSYIKNIAIPSLSGLLSHFEDIVLMKPDELYVASSCWFINKIAPSGKLYPPVMQKIRERFAISSLQQNRKVYITRQHSAVRKVINETEFSRLLSANDFEMIVAEELNLQQQVDLFSSTSTLIGMHGAGLTNCLFMSEKSRVIELRRDEHGPHNVGYWHLADSLQHYYYYYNGIPDSPLPLVGKGCNLTIPLQDFEARVMVYL